MCFSAEMRKFFMSILTSTHGGPHFRGFENMYGAGVYTSEHTEALILGV
jgi:hypothetical protein